MLSQTPTDVKNRERRKTAESRMAALECKNNNVIPFVLQTCLLHWYLRLFGRICDCRISTQLITYENSVFENENGRRP